MIENRQPVHQPSPANGRSWKAIEFSSPGYLAVFLVVIQIATGLLLLVHYRPTQSEALSSVARITTQTNFGWLIRGLHIAATHALLAVALLHFVIAFARRAYRCQRGYTWLSGLLMGCVALGLAFTGEALVASRQANESVSVAARLLASIPVLGMPGSRLLFPGGTLNSDVLGRMFALHAGMLPLAGLLLLAGHLSLVKRRGLSTLGGGQPSIGLPDLLAWVVVVQVMVACILTYPPTIELSSGVLSASASPVHPGWYFMPLFALAKHCPMSDSAGARLPVMFGAAFCACLPVAFLPVIARKNQGLELKTRLWTAGLVIAAIALMGWGYWGT